MTHSALFTPDESVGDVGQSPPPIALERCLLPDYDSSCVVVFDDPADVKFPGFFVVLG